MTAPQVRALVWAQWRSVLNNRGRSNAPFVYLFGVIWYGLWLLSAIGIAVYTADSQNSDKLEILLPKGLLAVTLYWQLVPLMMMSGGVNLDLKRLMVYPIPHAHLFGVEVLLRVTGCLEMLLVSAGLAVGVSLNPDLAVYAPVFFLPFVLFNLFVAVGLRDLLTRLLARKAFREVMVLVVVLFAALPQILLASHLPASLEYFLSYGVGPATPWGSAAAVILGDASPALAALLLWTSAAYIFGRRQFERSLRFDAAEVRNLETRSARYNIADHLLRIPSALFPDPMAALVEKELRSLYRSARFRLLFFMGFSFGLLIWLPLTGDENAEIGLGFNYLTVATSYAILLLSEVCFWNSFGLDRAAAQTYFVMPVKFSTVLVAKNIAAACFIFLEVVIIAGLCALIGMPVNSKIVIETIAVVTVLSTFLLACGNMLSTRYPRPVDPARSWGGGSMGRVQLYLLGLYPVASIPVVLAYGARYAFDSEKAFYGVIALDLLIGAIVYSFGMESAVSNAERRKEEIIMALSRAEGPMEA